MQCLNNKEEKSMNFVLFNLSISDSSLTEFEIDTILKEIPYGAKIGIKKERIDYSYILLPISTYEAFDEDFESHKNILENVPCNHTSNPERKASVLRDELS